MLGQEVGATAVLRLRLAVLAFETGEIEHLLAGPAVAPTDSEKPRPSETGGTGAEQTP